jgi:hypothetical protein
VRKGERFRSLVRLSTKAVKDKPYRNVRSSIHLRKAGVCLWTLSKTKSNTGLGRHRRMRRETPKTNKTVMRVVELEAPTSALASWGTSLKGKGQKAEEPLPFSSFCLLPPASCLLPPTSCLLPPAFCLLPSTSCLLPSTSCLLPSTSCLLPSALSLF